MPGERDLCQNLLHRLKTYEVIAEKVEYTSSPHSANVHDPPIYARKGEKVSGDIVTGSRGREWLKLGEDKFLPLKVDMKLVMATCDADMPRSFKVLATTRLRTMKNETGGRVSRGLYQDDRVQGSCIQRVMKGARQQEDWLQLAGDPDKYLRRSDVKQSEEDATAFKITETFAKYYRLRDGEMCPLDELHKGEKVTGWLEEGQWIMISEGANAGLYVPLTRLEREHEEDQVSMLMHTETVEPMPINTCYSALVITWCLYRSSGWQSGYGSLCRASFSMVVMSLLIQFGLLAMLWQVRMLADAGGDPHPCMYGIGQADDLFFPTGWNKPPFLGLGGFNVTADNRETDFGLYELQGVTRDALTHIFQHMKFFLSDSEQEQVQSSVAALDPAADGKVYGVETHVFRFLAIFLLVVQGCRDLWSCFIHFYLLPATALGEGSASWIQMDRGQASAKFVGYAKYDCILLFFVGLASSLIGVFTVFFGVDLLVGLTTVEDLLLNCLAVSFILDVDEIVFSSFAPTDLVIMLENVDFELYRHAKIWKDVRRFRESRYIPRWIFPILVPAVASLGFYCLTITAHCTFDYSLNRYVSRLNDET